MNMAATDAPSAMKDLPNGPGMAAILAAAIGCGTLGAFDFLGDAVPGIGRWFTFYSPTGTLSGVTDSAIVVWLVSWYVLSRRWRDRNVAAGPISIVAFLLLLAGFLLTFPPFMDSLQGR